MEGRPLQWARCIGLLLTVYYPRGCDRCKFPHACLTFFQMGVDTAEGASTKLFSLLIPNRLSWPTQKFGRRQSLHRVDQVSVEGSTWVAKGNRIDRRGSLDTDPFLPTDTVCVRATKESVLLFA